MNGVSSPGKPYWLNLSILLQLLSVCVYPNCGLDTDWTLIIFDNWSSSHKKNHVHWAPVISRVSSSTSSKSSSSSIMSTWKQRAFDKRIKRHEVGQSKLLLLCNCTNFNDVWQQAAVFFNLMKCEMYGIWSEVRRQSWFWCRQVWRERHSPCSWSRQALAHPPCGLAVCPFIASNFHQNSQIFSTILMLAAPWVLGYLDYLSLCGSGLLRQKNVLTSLSHGSIWWRDHQNSSIHLACSSHIGGKTTVQDRSQQSWPSFTAQLSIHKCTSCDHVLDIICVSRAVHVAVVPCTQGNSLTERDRTLVKWGSIALPKEAFTPVLLKQAWVGSADAK